MAKQNKVSCCECCAFYDYNDEMDCYECSADLDEDDMARFLGYNVQSCPYYTPYDEYKIVQKQN